MKTEAEMREDTKNVVSKCICGNFIKLWIDSDPRLVRFNDDGTQEWVIVCPSCNRIMGPVH